MAFCTRCGKQVEGGQLCNCSVAVSSDKIGHKPFYKRAKVWPGSTKNALKIVSILIVATILFAVIGAAITAPVNTARGYFRAKANNNWFRAYGYYHIPRSDECDFINRNSYIRANVNTDITDFEIFDESMFFSVDYYLRGNRERQHEVIQVINNGTALLFFDAFRVGTSNSIANNFHVSVPAGSVVHINDILLTRTVRNEMMGTHSVTFIIPQIFTGSHDLRVEHPSTEPLLESIQVRARDGSFEMFSLTMSESARNDLVSRTQDLYRMIIASALQGNSVEALNIRFTREESHRNGLINQYNRMSNILHTPEGVSGVSNINFTRFVNGYIPTELFADGVYTVEMHVDFDIEYISYDWDGEAHLETENDSATIFFTYVFENGEWVLQNFSPGF
jgi:hypothetical protein